MKLRTGPLNYLFMHTGEAGAYCLGVFDNGASGTLLGGISFRNILVQVCGGKQLATRNASCLPCVHATPLLSLTLRESSALLPMMPGLENRLLIHMSSWSQTSMRVLCRRQ